MTLLYESMRVLPEQFTPRAILSYFENLQNYNFKGIRLHFEPATRELQHTVWIDAGDPTWVQVDQQSSVSKHTQAPVQKEKV